MSWQRLQSPHDTDSRTGSGVTGVFQAKMLLQIPCLGKEDVVKAENVVKIMLTTPLFQLLKGLCTQQHL